jgi:hypothetical protein
VFVIMHEHVFAVKHEVWLSAMSLLRRLKDFARRVLLRQTSMYD